MNGKGMGELSGKAWVKVTIFAAEQDLDLMANVLLEHEANGVVVGEGWVAAFFATVGAWEERVNAIEQAVEDLPADLKLDECRVAAELVDDEDWTVNWRRHFRPFRVGTRLVVVPSWEDYAAGPDDVILRIDPALAFGSGDHPTTSMALVALEDLVTSGMNVIDVGTGSGILAIAASRLGARRVWALDIDDAAVHAATGNVRANGVESSVEVTKGSLQDLSIEPVDLIVANIVAGTIIKLAPLVGQYLKNNGWFLAGGIIDKRETDVVCALENAGLAIAQVVRQEEWVTLCATPGNGIHWREDAHAPLFCSSREPNQ